MQSGKDSTHPDHSFPYRHSLSHGDPSVSLSLDSSPKSDAEGVELCFCVGLHNLMCTNKKTPDFLRNQVFFMVDPKGIEPSNLTDANRALSQLSYGPLSSLFIIPQNFYL